MAAKNVKVNRSKKAYKMPEPLPKGIILKDVAKQTWVLGDTIGSGGFGAIYSASKETSKTNCFAIKVEPLENGPLFCERTIYINIGKEDLLDEFKRKHKLKLLGLPRFYGFGSYTHNSSTYRFIVIDRFGRDIWSILNENNYVLPCATVFKITIQILYVLEYLHERGYVHNDVKAANLLLGLTKTTESQVYLVDLGLACKYTDDVNPNPKKAHNGTLEYTSRDAHIGAMTRRGDLEVLAYNILHWLGGNLPWLNKSKPPDVEKEKIKYMKNIPELIATCFKSKTNQQSPASVSKFVTAVNDLKPHQTPDYENLRKILLQDIPDKSYNSKLVFKPEKANFSKTRSKSKLTLEAEDSLIIPGTDSEPESPEKKKSRNRKKVVIPETDSEEEEVLPKKKRLENPRNKKSPKKVETDANKDKKKTAVKRSWRDFPTVVNGGGFFKSDK